jgi:cytochrome c oxidase assembly protein subunit 15
MPKIDQRPIAYWLFACCAMVFATLVLGGITRLTHSGLSIVEWKPLVGTLPPLSHADWLEVFGKYQQTPEFIQRNHDMTLDGFKFIFWWEWAHRLSGRLIGAVFLFPYLWFLAKGALHGRLAFKIFGFFILGGLQGAMGWYMVKSGLVDNPAVSQYRLAAHLGLAFVIFGLMFWTALGLLQARESRRTRRNPFRDWRDGDLSYRLGWALTGLVFIMVLSGALVAGIRAGLAYNTFPLMNGHFAPPEMWLLDPVWLNFFSNMATVQFDHRLIAWALMGLIPWFSWRLATKAPQARIPALMLTGWLGVQVSLGIATLLLRVPISLAAMHQAGAMILFALLLWNLHLLHLAKE